MSLIRKRHVRVYFIFIVSIQNNISFPENIARISDLSQNKNYS